jgi:hypothetical protein
MGRTLAIGTRAGAALVGSGILLAQGPEGLRAMHMLTVGPPSVLRPLGALLIATGTSGLIATVLTERAARYREGAGVRRGRVVPIARPGRRLSTRPTILLIEIGLFALCAALLQGP